MFGGVGGSMVVAVVVEVAEGFGYCDVVIEVE